jgi:hypothetical protein
VWQTRFDNSEIVVGVLSRHTSSPTLIANFWLFGYDELNSAIRSLTAQGLDLRHKM